MKKQMALVFAMLAPPLTHAQSSVTLYGLIDSGITYVSNAGGKSNVVASDGIIQSNRFGLRGSEDLGGGTRAVFVLENGFNLNSGTFAQPGLIFGRQAYVGLSDQRWGTLTLGRQYEFTWDYLTIYSIGSRVGAYSFHPGDYDRLAGTLRINNSVKYVATPIGGLSIGALYAFGSDPASSGSGRAIAFGASYSGGVLGLATAYNNTHDVSLNPATQMGSSLGSTFPAGAFVAKNMQNVGAAASLTFGPSSTRAVFTATTISTQSSSVTMRTLELSEAYQFMPDLSASVGYSYTRMSPESWQNLAMVCDYLLSKRTDVYVSAVFDRAGGGARPQFLTLPASTTGRETTLRVGIRNFF
jgi:predicted porin